MNKKPIASVVILLLLMFCNLPVFASNLISENIYTLSDNGEYKPERADIIGYKYKTVDGVRYRRRWNYTQNRWEDPDWEICP